MDNKKNHQAQMDIRQEILKSALQLFAEKGYFNTSLTDIATLAKLSNLQTIYQHFENKQSIAVEIYENIFDSLSISIDDFRRRYQKPSEQLHSVVDLLFNLADEAPYVVQFLLISNLTEFLPAGKSLQDSVAFSKILKIIQAGIKNGEIRTIDPKLCYSYFFGIIDNVLRLVLTGTLDKKATAYQSQAWLAAWHVIAKKAGPSA